MQYSHIHYRDTCNSIIIIEKNMFRGLLKVCQTYTAKMLNILLIKYIFKLDFFVVDMVLTVNLKFCE